jgi:hypothetical protein
MRRRLVLWAILLFVAANADAQRQYAFRVSFTDKKGAPTLINPSLFLSQRAIDRRLVQNIQIDETDLPVSPLYVDTVLNATGGVFHSTSKWLNNFVVLLTDSSQILNLQGKPYISNIEWIGDYFSGLHQKNNENTTSGNTEPVITGSPTFYGHSFQQTKLVNGDYLHDRDYKGQGKLIAVLDEGFRFVDTNPAFDSLIKSGRLVDKYNFTRNNAEVFKTSSEHGTSALSTMAVYMPGIYVGAAPLAQYALYCTEIGGSEQILEMDNILAAVERADSIGADIITASIGYNEFSGPIRRTLTYQEIDGKTTIAAKAANLASAKGMLFIASAGNDGASSWYYVLTPGDADSALTIGSVDGNSVAASNSGHGPNASGKVKPDVCAMGQPATVLSNTATPFKSNGTSFATPQIAGWAACLWQATTKGTPNLIRTAIIKSASLYTNPNVSMGYGVPDFGKATEYLNIKDTPKNTDEWIRPLANPFTDNLTLRFYNLSVSQVDFNIIDISGRLISTHNMRLSHGTNVLELPTLDMPAGMYFIRATSGSKSVTFKVVKN